jgi:hypothetical protein
MRALLLFFNDVIKGGDSPFSQKNNGASDASIERKFIYKGG